MHLFAILFSSIPVVPKVGDTAPLGAVKLKWVVGGRYEYQLIITFLLYY